MMEEKLLHAEFKREVQLQAIVKKAQEEEAKVCLGVLNIELVTQVLSIVTWEVNIYQVFIRYQNNSIFTGSFEIYSVQYFILKIILWDIYYFYRLIEV